VPTTLKISTLEVKTFSFNEKEMPEDPKRRKHTHERALNLGRSNFRVKTYSFNEEEASKGPQRREHAPKLCPQPQRSDFQVKDRDFQVENQPLKIEIKSENFTFVHFVTNIRDYIQIL